jgi:hypothetical protein
VFARRTGTAGIASNADADALSGGVDTG